MSSMRLTLSNLPIELVYRILNHLSSFEILMSTRNVCPVLNRIIDTYQPNQDTHQLTLPLSSFSKFTPEQIRETLQQDELLDSLVLDLDVYNPTGIECFFELLRNNSRINRLKLNGMINHVNNNLVIIEEMMKNETLKTLDLQGNNLRPFVDYFFYPIVISTRTITTLMVNGSNMNDEQVITFSQGIFPFNRTITTLDLSMNMITDKGAECIGQHLFKDRKLIELNLKGNKISETGAQQLSNALKKNRTLKILNVEDNPLGEIGIRCFTKHNNKKFFFRAHKCKVLMTEDEKRH